MRHETRRRLERVILLQRLKWAAAGVACMAGLLGMFWLTSIDASVVNVKVSGVVEHVGPLAGKNANQGLAVDLKLDNGQHVQVIAYKMTDPHAGDHVTVTEHHHGTGRVTYSWK